MVAISSLLGWCTVINTGILLLWSLIFILAHDWMFGMHTRWFKLTEERFDEIHYKSMTFFKLSIFLFNLTPYLALQLIE